MTFENIQTNGFKKLYLLKHQIKVTMSIYEIQLTKFQFETIYSFVFENQKSKVNIIEAFNNKVLVNDVLLLYSS